MKQDVIWDYYQNDTDVTFRGSWARLSHVIHRLPPTASVLNVGIGKAVFECLAHAKGYDVHSVDPSERTVTKLGERLGLGDKVRVGRAEAIPFDDEKFDVVVISEVLEHLDDVTLRQALCEIRRVLRAGGRIIGTVPANENLDQQTIVCPQCGERFHRWGHLQSFDAQRLNSILAHEFTVEQIYRRLFVAFRWLNMKGKIVSAAKLLLSFSHIYGSNTHLVFIARK